MYFRKVGFEDKKMRIVNVMTSKVVGGVEQASVDYATALSRRGHDVLYVGDKRGKVLSSLNNEKIEKYGISFHHFKYYLIPLLYKKLKDFKADIVIVHTKKAIRIFKIVAHLLGIKLVAVAHNPKMKEIDKADTIFSISQYQKDIFVQKGYPAEKIYVIPNMIDDERSFFPSTSFQTPPVLAVLGRFEPGKGFEDFVRALSIVKSKKIPFHAVIGGTPVGDNQKTYESIVALIKELDLSEDIQLCGWVSDKDEFYKNLDVFILSSHHESFGIVLLEAMIRSKPIISSLAEGPAEIYADNQAAYTYPVGDYEALANQIEIALTDFSKTSKKAKLGYELTKQKYVLSKVAVVLEKSIESVVRS